MNKALNDYRYIVNLNPAYVKYCYYYAGLLGHLWHNKAAISVIDASLGKGSHWYGKLIILRNNIYIGKEIKLHKPLSN